MKRDGHKEIPKETKSFLIYLCAPVSLEFNAEYNWNKELQRNGKITQWIKYEILK